MTNATDLKEALSKGLDRLWKLHPQKTYMEICQMLTIEFYKRSGNGFFPYTEAVHFTRPNGNYYCYNGSAHLKTTDIQSHVTCEKCLVNMKLLAEVSVKPTTYGN